MISLNVTPNATNHRPSPNGSKPMPPASPAPPEPPAADMPRLLTRQEAADLLRVSERTLFTLTRRDAIPTVQIGAKVLYHPADLAAWVRDHTTTLAQEKTT